eukprot:Lankesteria_metandrocarpae@DN9841_c0_g1_i1.p1
MGIAPFGNPLGYHPHIQQPVVLPENEQPKYVLKIDITPLKPPVTSAEAADMTPTTHSPAGQYLPVQYKVTGGGLGGDVGGGVHGGNVGGGGYGGGHGGGHGGGLG